MLELPTPGERSGALAAEKDPSAQCIHLPKVSPSKDDDDFQNFTQLGSPKETTLSTAQQWMHRTPAIIPSAP